MTDENGAKHMLNRQQAMQAIYGHIKEQHRATFHVASEYGRWLVGSLVLIHGGALFGLFGFLDELASRPHMLQHYGYAIWVFVIGLVSALLSGMSAWWNWNAHAADFDIQTPVDMLWDPERTVPASQYTNTINRTYRLSILFGVISALCIILGAWTMLHGAKLAAANECSYRQLLGFCIN